MDNSIIDLICIEYSDRKEMSCAILYKDGLGDKLLGPVDFKGGVTKLAAMLRAELPERFPTRKEAEAHLAMIHLGNALRDANGAGQRYPFKVDAPKGEV